MLFKGTITQAVWASLTAASTHPNDHICPVLLKHSKVRLSWAGLYQKSIQESQNLSKGVFWSHHSCRLEWADTDRKGMHHIEAAMPHQDGHYQAHLAVGMKHLISLNHIFLTWSRSDCAIAGAAWRCPCDRAQNILLKYPLGLCLLFSFYLGNALRILPFLIHTISKRCNSNYLSWWTWWTILFLKMHFSHQFTK